MKILAVDTATKSCSVAIIDRSALLAEKALVVNQTHSKHLMGMIDSVMKMAGLKISDLDGFAVTKGPGSFTGLRIGISAVKGLSAASGKPLVGVSTLDALAFPFSMSSYLICPLLDAYRGEVYVSLYRFKNGTLKEKSSEKALSPEKLIQDIKEECLFVGNGAISYKSIIKEKMGKTAHFSLSSQNEIRASTVANLSVNRFINNDTDDTANFVPHYIRKSDAEMSITN